MKEIFQDHYNRIHLNLALTQYVDSEKVGTGTCPRPFIPKKE